VASLFKFQFKDVVRYIACAPLLLFLVTIFTMVLYYRIRGEGKVFDTENLLPENQKNFYRLGLPLGFGVLFIAIVPFSHSADAVMKIVDMFAVCVGGRCVELWILLRDRRY